MKFCAQCAGPLEDRVPPGDDRPRRVCRGCDAVHYQNPVVVVGCLVECDGGLLLCRRAIEPKRGLWTVPAGFLELGEALADGAQRETWEEALARVEITAPHAYFDLTHIGQVYALFRARLTAPEFGPGEESLECRVFGLDELPWAELAFPAVHFALRVYEEDAAAGQRHLHHGQVAWNGRGSRFDAANYAIRGHLRTPLA